MADPNEGNPFEQETDAERSRRVRQMMRENVDKRIRYERIAELLYRAACRALHDQGRESVTIAEFEKWPGDLTPSEREFWVVFAEDCSAVLA